VHVQLPDEQVEIMHLAPAPHASRQSPAEQLTVQSPPLGHDVLQWPPEQATLHVPAPQYVRQWPAEQSSVQSPEAGHLCSQLPAEQSVAQGDVLQSAVQLPAEQAHAPDEHEAAMRDDAVPGSAMAGPPFGVPPEVVLLEPPQAVRKVVMTSSDGRRTRMRGFLQQVSLVNRAAVTGR
jgi:hypothetical protein